MPLTYLVDTDFVIQHFRRIQPVTARLQELWPEGIALSIISLAELWEGVIYSRAPEARKEELAEFVRLVEVVTLDEAICRIFGEVRGRLRSQGKRIADLDLLIAATALIAA
jgi:tRNA(fMet)-specific endonuclease VapC